MTSTPCDPWSISLASSDAGDHAAVAEPTDLAADIGTSPAANTSSPGTSRASRSRSPPRSPSAGGGSWTRALVPPRVGLGPGGAPSLVAQRPPPPHGTAWWQERVWTACETTRNQLPLSATREMVVESLFCGMCTELFADAALGIPVLPQCAADCKKAAVRFVTRNHQVEHIYTDARHMCGGAITRKCLKCGVDCPGPSRRPDFVRMGMPCQPFTKARIRNQAGDCGPPDQHRHWSTCFGLVFDYLETRRPRGFLVEEVMGFGDRDRNSGQPHVLAFQTKCAELGYAARSAKFDAKAFVAFGRPRIFVWGLSEELGHAKGAQWMLERFLEVEEYVTLAPPVPLFPTTPGTASVLSLDSDAMKRREQTEAESEQDEKQKELSSKQLYSKWRRSSAAIRSKYKISTSFMGWTSRPDIRGVPQTARQQDLVNTVQQFPGGTPTTQMRENWWVDLSQDVSREPWSEGVRVATKQSIFYSFQFDLCLAGYDLLVSLGVPHGKAPASEFSNSDLRSLGGEGYSAPVVGALSMIFWMNPWAPWWRQ